MSEVRSAEDVAREALSFKDTATRKVTPGEVDEVAAVIRFDRVWVRGDERAKVLAEFEWEWANRNSSGGAGIHHTREAAEAQRDADVQRWSQPVVVDAGDDWTPVHHVGIERRLVGPWQSVGGEQP